MKLFNLSLSTLMLRFYLMMAIVIGSMFAGVPLLAILAFPVFFITMMGIEFKRPAWYRSRKSVPEASETREPAMSSSHQPVH